jgi:putative ABC transport system permease protein
MLKEWMTRLRFLIFSRPPSDLDEELRFHVEQSVERNVAAGMSAEEARRQALIELGGVEAAREQAHRQRPGWWLGTVGQDARYALRGFRRNPVFAIAVIATLMVAIGATAAVFSVVDRILFRALPYAQDDRLVSVGLSQSLEKQEFTLGGFFFDWRDQQKPFSSLTYESGFGDCNLTDGDPVHLQCSNVAQNFLTTMGMVPEAGRNFALEEDVPNGPKVIMISDGLWLSRFNRDPGAVGQSVSLDGHPVRIVGVLPRNFEMPRLQPTDILRPAQIDISEQHRVNSGIGFPLWAFAQLKPGVSVAEAKAEMEPLYLHTREWIPAEIRMDFHLVMRSLRDRQMQDSYRAAWVLLGAVFTVLLIACANVASLFSARGAARERELAVRSALGASRARLIRQTLTEAILLSAVGAGAGLGLAEILLRVFIAIAPTGVPFLALARLDLRIVAFTVLVSMSSTMLFGIMPALEKPKTDALTARQAKSGARARLRQALVAGQIALSVVLLCGASLLVRSFWNLARQSLGLQTSNVLLVHVPLEDEKYPAGFMVFYLRAEAALKRIPGVTAVGMSDSVPPGGVGLHMGMRYSELLVPGRQRTPPGVGGSVTTRIVTPAYFRVLHIPIVEGPGFSEEERGRKDNLMVLSHSLAARLFPEGNAVGQKVERAIFNPTFQHGPVYTVVGVAADVKNAGLTGEDEPELYKLGDVGRDQWDSHHFFVLETSLPASVITPWIKAQVKQLDPVAPVEVTAMTEVVSKLADRPRFETSLLGFFALCGLLMAVIGLYGVISFVATQRTQEIGVRMALGATRGHILQLIAVEGVRLILLGGVAGLCGAALATRLMASLLFNVRPHDPVTYAVVVILLAAVALTATLIPARTAMKVEPMAALRRE